MASPETLTLDLDGWEGPLDLLLTLARTQKVDLRAISVLELARQYMAFIAEAQALQLEVAADYLVMAAWLAYLKSALLLPGNPDLEPSPEELAAHLQRRLERLHAMRNAGARLMARDRLDRDVFRRPTPEGLHADRQDRWKVSLYDLIQAYGRVSARTRPVLHIVAPRPVVTLEAALERLGMLIGQAIDWTRLESFLIVQPDPVLRRSALASSFVATLELARRGRVDLRQQTAFTPLFLKVAS